MNVKQKMFVKEYLIDLNATQAAIRAGYSKSTATKIAHQLLTKLDIQAAINHEVDARSKRVEISADYVLANIVEINERCMQRVPVMRYDREEKCMVQVKDESGQGVWQFDAAAALKANELLGKHLKMFRDQHDINVRHSYEELLCGKLEDGEGK